MDFIIILSAGAILDATGVISPEPKDNDISEEVKVVKTEEVTPPAPEPEPTPNKRRAMVTAVPCKLRSNSNLLPA